MPLKRRLCPLPHSLFARVPSVAVALLRAEEEEEWIGRGGSRRMGIGGGEEEGGGKEGMIEGGNAANDDRAVVRREESESRDSAQTSGGNSLDQVLVSEFDYSVENFFAAMDAVDDLCGAPCRGDFETSEIERFSSMITFLKEWKFFYYEPKVVNFSSEQVKSLPEDVKLPQFSSASVPKMMDLPDDRKQSNSSDFILNAGGLVWALDWCPDHHGKIDSKIKCEYLAVAAHPPSSSYHKLGAPLVGRGVIQIWCLLNVNEDITQGKCQTQRVEIVKQGRPRGRPRKKPAEEKPIIRRRGRPRKRKYSSSDDEDNITLIRLKKKLLRHKIDQNAPKESLQSPIVSTEKISAKSFADASSVRRSRGRSRKHQLSGITDLNEKKEAQSLNNSIIGTAEVAHSCIDSSNNLVGLSISSYLVCEDQLLKPRRGRPRKKPIPCANNCVSSSTVSDKAVLQNPSKPGAVGVKEIDAYNDKQVLGTRETLLLLTESQNSSVSSAIVALENDGTALPNLSGPGAPDEGLELTACTNNEILRTGDHVPTFSIELQNCEAKLVQPRGRGRARKRPILNLDMSDPASSSLIRKDINDIDEDNNKGQNESEIVPFDVKGSRDSKRRNEEGLDSEGQILSNFSNDSNLPASSIWAHENHSGDLVSYSHEVSKAESVNPSIPQVLALPRVVLCLAHNGKVAWDVKWRPATENGACKGRMGYLAVLLGNGSLEVWEVPLPQMVKTKFTSTHDKDTDPRFLKLTPVLRCSKVKRGERQSIPLTVEWSPSLPHDLILAGCHDGTVILWKFCTKSSTQDTRPLLCFNADSVPVRALAWAPASSEAESNNLFVIAGHEGLKFWDLRDPYRPLWEINPVQRAVLSVDWVKDPRCLVIALEDGTLRMLSLCNTAYDVPATGKPFVGTKFGLNCFPCSSFAIWSIHVSQTTGFAAYCCADGSTIRFQLTTKFVDKDPRRHRTPHILCGSLFEEGGALKIHVPLSNAPLPQFPSAQKKSSNECGNENRGLLPPSNAKKTKQVVSDSQVSQKTKPKSSRSKKTDNLMEEEASKIDDREKILAISKTKDEESEFEVLPSKNVAFYKVRWNNNKGSEGWLCYGGAAGIIRCQRITL